VGLAGTQTWPFPRASLDAFNYTVFIVTFDKNFMVPSERERKKMPSADRKFLHPFIFFCRGRLGNTFDVVKWLLSSKLST
jgi:hypothetical protein